jgi:hypothetical protein
MDRQIIYGALLISAAAQAQTIQLPTANHGLEKGGEERFFVGTAGKTWITGTFGLVVKRGSPWELATHGLNLLEWLTY